MLTIRLSARFAPALLFMPMLCGCGSDTGGNVASTPAPVSPTYATLDSGTGTLGASGGLLNFTRAAGAAIPSSSASSPDVTISYNASSQTYTISANIGANGGTTTASYGPAQVDTSQGISRYYSATTVANGVTTVSTLQLRSAATPVLTYSNVGTWTTGATQADGSQNFNTIYFSYGVRTLASDMPRTGSATYGLNLGGESPGGAGVQGSGTLSANFGAGTVSVSLTPEIVYGPTRISSLGPITGSGTISSSTSSFMSTISSSTYSGTVNGSFYGPQAAEIGGNFILNSSSNGGLAAVGAFSGKKN